MTRFLKEVREVKPAVEVCEGDMLTLTEAAQLLGLSTSAMGDLVYRGVLTRFIDTKEPNPTRANRVLRAEVEKELQRRRERTDDARIKQRRMARGLA